MRGRRPGAGPSLGREESRKVSERLRELRRARNLRQADVAAVTGVSATMVAKLETGRSLWREPDAEKAAVFLGTTLADILPGERPVRPPVADRGPRMGPGESRTVSERVRELRAAAGVLQAGLAEALGLKQPALSRLEAGRDCWRRGDAERALVFLARCLEDKAAQAGSGAGT